MEKQKQPRRLLSLDTLRGFDMFFIMGGGSFLLAVASFLPGDCAAALAGQMGHKEWHGFAFYDLIFPLFLSTIGKLSSLRLLPADEYLLSSIYGLSKSGILTMPESSVSQSIY